ASMSSMRRSVSAYRTLDGVADPSPDVGQWRRSLRALDPDANKKLSYSGDLFKPRDFTQRKKPGDLSVTAALEREYTLALQQQIRLLEIENGDLRSRVLESSASQQQREAPEPANDRLLQELKALEKKMDDLQADSARKDAAADELQRRVIYLASRLADREEEEAGAREDATAAAAAVRAEEEELLTRQRERDELRLRVAALRRRVAQLEGLDGEARLYDDRARTLRTQLNSALSKLAATGAAVSSERAAVARLEAEVRRLERQMASLAGLGDDSATLSATARLLREENRRLRRRTKSASGTAYVRAEDLAALANRNAALEAAVRRLEAELAPRSSTTAGAEEVARLRERERQLEQQADLTAREASELTRRLAQLEADGAAGGVTELTRHCRQLQRDNAQLARQVRGLEAELERKRAEKATVSAAVESSEVRLSQLQAELSKLQELQASRWSEVEKIATSIKSAARSNTGLLEQQEAGSWNSDTRDEY
ncbi:hypothetical protein BOX15_Mlig007651g1, partial [Macrostomum lignano]